MSLILKSLEQMFDETKIEKLLFFDLWSPLEHPERCQFITHPKLGEYIIPKTDYVKNVFKYTFKNTKIAPDGLLEGAVILGIENSLTRGHNKNITYPISLKIFGGKYGCVIRIRDSGAGFNYFDVTKRYLSGDRTYVNGHGMGLIILDSPVFEAAYDNNGTALNILIKNGYSEDRSKKMYFKK